MRNSEVANSLDILVNSIVSRTFCSIAVQRTRYIGKVNIVHNEIIKVFYCTIPYQIQHSCNENNSK